MLQPTFFGSNWAYKCFSFIFSKNSIFHVMKKKFGIKPVHILKNISSKVAYNWSKKISGLPTGPKPAQILISCSIKFAHRATYV